MPQTRRFRSLFAFALLAGCAGNVTRSEDGGADAAADVASDAPRTVGACTAVARTCAQVTASFASNSMNVAVSCDATAGTFTIRSSGVPNYDSNQTTHNDIRDQGWVAVIPLTPACATLPTDAVNSRGELGFMINGVPFYGPQDANGNDAVRFEGSSFDDCEGHADPSCSYHYHEEPLCVFGVRDTAARHLEADGHPPVIGYALDGFAIYAAYAATMPTELDACNGHVDATRGFHYHASGASPYLMGCYRGAVTGRVMRTMNLCGMTTPTDGGMPPGDAMVPPGDAMMPPAEGGMMGPHACTTTADCPGFCPPSSIGCACASTMMGRNCVPTCNSTADCPTTPMGPQVCDTGMHLCHP